MQADHNGRPPNPPATPDGLARLRAQAGELQLEAAAPKPIVLGRHLLELGLNPGPELGRMLAAAFEAQLEGKFNDPDGGCRWVVKEFQIEN